MLDFQAGQMTAPQAWAPACSAIVSAAIVLRIILIVLGVWQDANLEVPYTDVDYQVFTDAAELIAHGATRWLHGCTCKPWQEH